MDNRMNQPNAFQGKIGQLEMQINNLQQMISAMQAQGSVRFPEQQKMGQIKYPNLYIIPFTWVQEVLEKGRDKYSTTQSIASGDFVFSNIYSFVNRVSFALQRTAAPDQSNLPVGCWLPLSCAHNHPFITDNDTYIGNDFFWRAQSAVEGSLWQSGMGWRTSKEADKPEGFVLDAEYQSLPGDTLTIEVQPLRDTVSGDTYELYCLLHGYKMIAKSEGYNGIS